MKRVVCFGSAIIDVMVKSKDFRVLKSHQVEGGVALCEIYGGKSDVQEIKMAVGGGGTNVAVGLARLGLTTAAVVRVGKDMFGQLVKDNLKNEGVEVSLVQEAEGGQTGMTVALVAPDGGRSLLTERGASREIKSEEVDWDKVEKADWIQVSSLGGNIQLLEDVVNWANFKGIKVGMNPGKGELVEKERLLKLIPKTELVVMNKMEATELLGRQYDEIKEAAEKMLKMGAKMVVITDGKKGAAVALEKKYIWAQAYKVKSADDTGAGDAFCAGLVAGILQERELVEALKMGLANGASEVTELGVKEGLLKTEDVERWLKKPVKVVEETI